MLCFTEVAKADGKGAGILKKKLEHADEVFEKI